MKAAVVLFIFLGTLGLLLALDASSSHIIMRPEGFEAGLAVPAVFFLLGAIATVIASILAVIDVIRSKTKFRQSAAIWWCVALMTIYLGLIVVPLIMIRVSA